MHLVHGAVWRCRGSIAARLCVVFAVVSSGLGVIVVTAALCGQMLLLPLLLPLLPLLGSGALSGALRGLLVGRRLRQQVPRAGLWRAGLWAVRSEQRGSSAAAAPRARCDSAATDAISDAGTASVWVRGRLVLTPPCVVAAWLSCVTHAHMHHAHDVITCTHTHPCGDRACICTCMQRPCQLAHLRGARRPLVAAHGVAVVVVRW
jgi:hypothetical protein